MNARNFRWTLFLLALASLTASFFTERKLWAAGVFFCCGSGWYWLARRKTRELDGRRPR